MPATAIVNEREQAGQYQYEYRPAIDAYAILDPQGFMRGHARKLVDQKHTEAVCPECIDDPLTDLIGGARMAVAFAETAHPEAEAAYTNHENDIRTAYTEALIKSGHISEVYADLNALGEAAIGDIAHWEIFLRAAPKSNPNICSAEIAEEFASAALYQNPTLRDNYSLVVISPARADTRGDTMMIRLISFEQARNGVWTRKTQQLYMGNSNIDDARRLLHEWGLVSNNILQDEVEILSHPVLLRKSNFPEGIAQIAQKLDSFASERHGQPIFCGVPIQREVAPERYTSLLSVSRERESQIMPEARRLARDIYDIVATQNLSFVAENQAYEQLLLASLRRICSDYPEYAEAAFGKQAAEQYHEAHARMIDGDNAGAHAALESAFENSKSVDICGTTIGEESQSPEQDRPQSKEEIKEAFHCLELKLKGYTIRRNVRCPACYAVTKRKVDAYETQDTIRCMDSNCGYHIHKETGRVLRESSIQKKQETKTTVSSLIPGRSYRLGNANYFYMHQLVDGKSQPKLITDSGRTITGEKAYALEQAIISFQQIPLWMLWFQLANIGNEIRQQI